jgi:ABC-type Fe3+/spermidine/putrescine transport system ATPase subunit
LARAIVLEPRVLLFDEPLSNLDAKLREKMRFELRQLHQRLGITSIYVTHDQTEAMVLADRVVLLNHGRIEQLATPIDLYRRPTSRFAAEFIGSTNIIIGRVLGSRLVQLDTGVKLECDCSGFTAGQAVQVLCRPEDLEASLNEPAGANVLRGSLASNVFLGSAEELVIEADGQRLTAQVSPPRLWAPGANLWVHLPPEAIIVLPLAT